MKLVGGRKEKDTKKKLFLVSRQKILRKPFIFFLPPLTLLPSLSHQPPVLFLLDDTDVDDDDDDDDAVDEGAKF